MGPTLIGGKAHTELGQPNRLPESDPQIKRPPTLWTLQYGTHTCAAELWGITSSMALPSDLWAYDVRYFVDNELRETRLCRGTATAAVAAALDKRGELVKKRWRNWEE